ncbi:MAG TPA: 2-hydroxyacyl-CoA dehydratase family protein [Steroidobacteraceae bacterium]|jgi:hypothetical protein|nr:2-hydroxyacyl-CoA dehydratase family protein [Steroidobacteraceae bacterium]
MSPAPADNEKDMSVEERLSAVLGDPLGAAAAGGALGFVGLDIPPDLLLAHGAVSCHLPLRLPRDTSRTSRWLESSFPPWAHSILESWWQGEFRCFDHVIFSRGDDVCHRLYYYICELQRQGRITGPQPLVFDVARIPRASSRRYTAQSLRELASRLGIEPAAMRRGVLKANAWRRLFGDIRRQRRGLGSFYERLVRASLYTDPCHLLQDWKPDDREPSHGGIVLGGSSPPDDRIHLAVEQAGCAVVEELYDRGLHRLGFEVDATAQDLPQVVADRWLDHHLTPRDLSDSAAALLEAVQRTRAVAAILWCTREDEALAWQVAAQRTALERSGVPALVLVARSWAFDDGADEQIRSFLEGVVRASA